MVKGTHNLHAWFCPVSTSAGRRAWGSRIPRRKGCLKASVDEAPQTPEVTSSNNSKQKPEKIVPESKVWEEIKDDPRMTEVYDQLIDLFKSKSRDKWKKLITISRNWMMLAVGLFERIDSFIEAEGNPGKKLEWMTFRKALVNVHTEVSRYDSILVEFISSASWEWDAIVSKRREDMTPGFFEHLADLIAVGVDDPKEQEKLKEISSSAVALVEMYDQAIADQKGLDMAKDSLLDILQSDSIEEADKRMDQLAASGGLDGAMMLTLAKMYTSVKESDYTKDEVKHIMYHLYMKSKETLESQQPPVVRILKYVLTLEDPGELRKCLDDAFTPGQLPSADMDYLSCTPAEILKTINSVLATFDQQKGKHTTLGEASSMLNPDVIQKLRKLEVYIRKEYV